MAGEQVIYAIGHFKKLTLNIGNSLYCEECVLRNPAQNLLLGNNFYTKYKMIIDHIREN